MTSVKRRRVFYIPGYDPIHPRRYRELYRSEGAAQAEISDYSVDLSARSGGETYGWTVDGQMDGQRTQAEFDVLVWSDIVRGSMDIGIIETYWVMLRTSYTYIMSGALRRLMRLRKGPVIAALYPIGMLILQLLIAVALGMILANTGRLVSQSLWGFAGGGQVTDTVLRLISWAIFIPVVMWVLQWFKAKDGKFFVYYLMHDYSYSAASRGANPPALEARMAQFKDKIASALHDDVDEVLVVGHSSGAHLGVSILSDLIRDGGTSGKTPKLSFLSLGQVVPMVSFLPDAWRLRADLAYLSTRDELTWVDVTAPGDGCAFALCDPVSVSVPAPTGKRWPLVFSAAFTQTLSPARWKELRWRFFRLHFQYLCAFDRPKDYDYFQITAGPMTLAERYKDRGPSKSRIERLTSKYTSVAP